MSNSQTECYKWLSFNSKRPILPNGSKPNFKAFLTPTAKVRRFEWCKENVDRQWSNVIFTDHMTIQPAKEGLVCDAKPGLCIGNGGHVKGMTKYGREKILVWGAITRDPAKHQAMLQGVLRNEIYLLKILPLK